VTTLDLELLPVISHILTTISPNQNNLSKTEYKYPATLHSFSTSHGQAEF